MMSFILGFLTVLIVGVAVRLTFAKIWTVQWWDEAYDGPGWRSSWSEKKTLWAARRILKNRRGAYPKLMWRVWIAKR